MSDDGDLPESLGDARCLRESAKAILARLDGVGDIWVPKSVIHDDSEVWNQEHAEGELIVKAWWAAKEGLA